MRIVQLLLLACAVGSADTLTNLNFSSGSGVIGTAVDFNTQSISVSDSGGIVTVWIDLDYDDGNATIGTVPANTPGAGNQYLEHFLDGTASNNLGTLYVGDLFFYDPASPTTVYTQSCQGTNSNPTSSTDCVTVPTAASLLYGVVLDGGDGIINANLVTGGVYQLNSAGDPLTETAQNAYGENIYRPEQVVEMTGTSTPLSTAVESVCVINGTTCGHGSTAQYQVTLTFSAADLSSTLISEINNGQIGVEFSAADCGNAVLAGSTPATPEPGTLGMIAAGIGMLCFGLARRRRKN